MFRLRAKIRPWAIGVSGDLFVNPPRTPLSSVLFWNQSRTMLVDISGLQPSAFRMNGNDGGAVPGGLLQIGYFCHKSADQLFADADGFFGSCE